MISGLDRPDRASRAIWASGIGQSNGSRKSALMPKDPFYSFGEPSCAFVEAIIEQISVLDRPERAATTDFPIWDFAIIEPDWDKPRLIWGPESHLVYCQHQFLILKGLSAGEASTGEAG